MGSPRVLACVGVGRVCKATGRFFGGIERAPSVGARPPRFPRRARTRGNVRERGCWQGVPPRKRASAGAVLGLCGAPFLGFGQLGCSLQSRIFLVATRISRCSILGLWQAAE